MQERTAIPEELMRFSAPTRCSLAQFLVSSSGNIATSGSMPRKYRDLVCERETISLKEGSFDPLVVVADSKEFVISDKDGGKACPNSSFEDRDPDTGPTQLQNNAYYVGVRSVDLNPLDLVARRIIACKFSGLHDPADPVRQTMRDIETVACAVVCTDTLLIAHNFAFGKRGDNLVAIEKAATETVQTLHSAGFINRCQVIHPLNSRKRNFHAEMQIIEHCAKNNLPIRERSSGFQNLMWEVRESFKSLWDRFLTLYWASHRRLGCSRVPSSPRPAL